MIYEENLVEPPQNGEAVANGKALNGNGVASEANGVTEKISHKNGVIGDTSNRVVEPVAGFENVQQDDAQQYLNNYKAHRTGISHEEMVKVYTDWANNYDKDLCPGRYNGPEIAAKFMAEHYPAENRESLKILDVAAGTGRVGHELYNVGFRNIDGLEPSPGMLNVLKGRNIYKDTFENAIGFTQVETIPNDSYDALVIAGGMGEGHIPVKAIDEMLRIVKPGGTIFIVMREEYLSYVQEYVGKLEPYMNALADEGFWRQVSRTIVPEYSFNKTGVVFNYEVLAKESPKA